ncbi:MAG: hypothetical protein LBP67_02875 [Bacteroidales bacterium]|jgi:hypothetical protein|nr:hypothetical protein [Bacteroidales bacterium]
MKKIKFLGALIVMLFISTSVFGQAIPAYTYVEDTPVNLAGANKGASVTVEWVGSNGHIIQSPKLSTTVTAIANGVFVPSGTFFISANFYPIVETRVAVIYSHEKHAGIYPGLATLMSRTLHPTYWIVP